MRADQLAPRPSQAGLTLVEVAIASVVVGFALVAGMSSLSQSATVHAAQAPTAVTSFLLSQEIHALALALPRDAGSGVPAADAGDVLVLDDLDGAVFDPPITAHLTTLGELSGWSQSVSLREVGLADPGIDAVDTDGADVLWEVSVDVRENSDIQGRYTWWVAP